MPEENLWILWWKGRLTEADTPTIRLGATPSGLTSAHLHHPPIFTGRMPFLPPNQQCQSTECNYCIRIREKMVEFSSTVLPAPSPYHTGPRKGLKRPPHEHLADSDQLNISRASELLSIPLGTPKSSMP